MPSTFGKQKSFLDYLEEGTKDQRAKGMNNVSNPFDLSDFLSFQKYFDPSLKEVQNIDEAIKHQIQTFSKEQEYGLLNRLDNDTAGLLYFAKDLSTFDNYRQLQAQMKIEKHYIAQIQGKNPLFSDGKYSINDPIMHCSLEKMIVIKSTKDIKKGRGKAHEVQTIVQLLEYEPISDISALSVTIHKGIRHQIRVHLASVGSPIIGDPLYGEKRENENLHLWSVGFNIKNS